VKHYTGIRTTTGRVRGRAAMSQTMAQTRTALLLVLYCCVPVVVQSQPPDIIRPLPFTVLQTNGVRLTAQPSDSDIAWIEFLVSYIDPNRNGRVVDTICRDSLPPYDIVWDCYAVPDQSWLDLQFTMVQVGHDGSRSRAGPRNAVLDRNRAFSNLAAFSPRTRSRVVLDGLRSTGEGWPDSAHATLLLDDNRAVVYSCWDRQYLYLFADMRDSVVFTRFAQVDRSTAPWDSVAYANLPSLPQVWLDDCVGFFFDVNCSRSSMPQPDDRKLYVSAAGAMLTIAPNPSAGMDRNWGRGIRCAALRDSMGYEIYAVDREFEDRQRVVAAWSCSPHNHNNPSEWGTMVLAGSPYGAAITVWAAILAMLSGAAWAGVALQRRRIAPDRVPDPRPATAKPCQALSLDDDSGMALIEAARCFIMDHLTETALGRELVATHLRVSPHYLGRHFKQSVGRSIPEFINAQRIERAKQLLHCSGDKVTTVALDCGYNTLDHFIRVFKQHTGQTPQQFRDSTGQTPPTP
jgi:AraC-like DNA-binding protein